MLKPLGYTFVPRWLSERAICLYLGLLLAVAFAFHEHMMAWYFVLFGLIEVIGFFFYANYLTKEWHTDHVRNDVFVMRLFYTSLAIRVVYVLFSYWFYQEMTGIPFEYHAADSLFYHTSALHGAQLLRKGSLWDFWRDFNLYMGTDISDTGYATYLSVVYSLTNDSVLVTRFIKAILSAMTVTLIYRLARRNFNEDAARMAGIFCMLMPNLVFYCGLQLKETEMICLTVLLVEESDKMLRSKDFSFWQLILVLLIGAGLFTMRTALAIVAILSLLFTIVLASEKVMSWAKRLIIGVLAVGLIGVTIGNRIEENAKELMENVHAGGQKTNMEWRAQRENGNEFAKYAGSAVFAPMIFTIPFATLVSTPEQENQLLIHGGNFVKNILSGLVIFAMFVLLLTGTWRRYAMPLAFMVGYLVVLVFSSFAHSERFHLPVVPFELMFAAYALGLVGKREKKWMNWWFVLIFVANVAWQWFKLAGRGMI
ncbi:MAG: glycosyltransferase family 39 protein [Paludibacteraceae bacterium]|nr:glycosyltransferase family 39 protein [Paludibacteraceae bacterium]